MVSSNIKCTGCSNKHWFSAWRIMSELISCCSILACKPLPLGLGCWPRSVWDWYSPVGTACSSHCWGHRPLTDAGVGKGVSRAPVPLFFLNILAFPCRMSPEILCQLPIPERLWNFVVQQHLSQLFLWCAACRYVVLCLIISLWLRWNTLMQELYLRSPEVWLTGKVRAPKCIPLLNVFPGKATASFIHVFSFVYLC